MSAAKLYAVPADAEPAGLRRDQPSSLVLIVDDDDAHRAGVGDLLTEEGYEVLEAANGKEALDLLVDRSQRLPALILLDLTMPVLSGWELLSILKAYVRLADIPVVVFSASEPRLDTIKHGVIANLLSKPCDVRTLLETVARHARPAALEAAAP